MAATGRLYTPPDIIKRQAIRANLLAKATATNFGGFRSSSEASQGVGLRADCQSCGGPRIGRSDHDKDGRKFTAKLIGRDAPTDVALLQVKDPNGLKAIKLGDSDRLEVGDFVIAVGNPFGLGQTVTSGLVSALGRTGLVKQGYEDFIQTDAAINPGNSGGGLIDLKGELVGINTAIVSPAGGNVGIGVAVPINMARKVMQQLITGVASSVVASGRA